MVSYVPADWLVQYSFYDNVIPRLECTALTNVGKPVAVIRVEKENPKKIKGDEQKQLWNPFMKDVVKCRCPHNIYHMQGWWLMSENDTEFWDYSYECTTVSIVYE